MAHEALVAENDREHGASGPGKAVVRAGAHGRLQIGGSSYGGTMEKQVGVVLYVLALVVVVIAVDLLFFRHRFLERLLANIGIVLVFAAFYLRFLK
jgi:hypothetical protein